MLIIGVLVSAVVMAPVLNLLLNAYGIGPATPQHPQSLTAPQATLMQSVAEGVFRGGLPWTMVVIGMIMAAGIIAFDVAQEKRGRSFRTPVLAVAIGIYLPFELSVPIFLGGIIAWLVQRAQHRIPHTSGEEAEQTRKEIEQRGMLIASGLITGEALVGIGMAIPIVLSGRADVLAVFGVQDRVWPGVAILIVLLYGIYRASVPRTTRS
jgi:putative OPT family oligopeptide transporter